MDRFDALIDRALRSYAEPAEVPEARVALARVMERARASESRRRGWWALGSTAAAVGSAAMVVMGTVLMMSNARRAEIAWTPQAPGVVSEGMPSGTSIAKSHVVAQPRSARLKKAFEVRETRTAVTKQLPKLDSFPTPRPLTAEEQALVAFAKHGPHEVQRAVLEDQKHWDDPIIVADLQEQPVQRGKQQIQ